MKQTPLHDWHCGHGASMTEFGGWHMPLYYGRISEEHQHTRTVAGLFDTSHMGRIVVSGPGAREFADYVTPAKLSVANSGDVLYSFLLTETGCPIDDITLYVEDSQIMFVVNAGNRERALDWLCTQAASRAGVTVTDRSAELAMIALQGPRSDEFARRFLGDNLPAMGYYRFARVHSKDPACELICSTTGYTGEGGYEFYLPAQHAVAAWEKMIGAGGADDAHAIGLGARDSLRLEAAMPLYGHELTGETTPFAAGLGRFVDMEKPDFIGRQALLAEKQQGGPARKLVCFEVTEKGPVARQGHALLAADGRPIGAVTSGVQSPTLQKAIGMGYVEAPAAVVGSEIKVEIRGRQLPARIVKRPFYKRGNK